MALPDNVTVDRYDYAQLREVYGRSSMVVVPVRQTDFQAGITTILEAMAMGKPTIATRTEGTAEGLNAGENCLLTPPGDVAALRQAIVGLLDSPDAARDLGKRARDGIELSMTLDHWVERISAVINRVYADRCCAAAEDPVGAEKEQ